MIVILRQVVVGWEVLLIKVQAVALSLEANLLVLDHRYLKGHVLIIGPVRRCNTEGGGGSIMTQIHASLHLCDVLSLHHHYIIITQYTSMQC